MRTPSPDRLGESYSEDFVNTEKSSVFTRAKEMAASSLEFVGQKIGNGFETVGKAFMRADAWIDKKVEGLKKVSSEWMGDVIDTVKMHTTEKWKFLNEQKGNNKLIDRKNKEIEKLMYQGENEARNITLSEQSREQERNKFDTALNSIKDPRLQEIFSRNRDEKVQEWDQKIKTSKDLITHSEVKRNEYASQIVDFRKNIEFAGDDFSGKIDGHVDRIREKCGYEKKMKQMEGLNEQISIGEEDLSFTTEKISEYEEALSTAEGLGVELKDLKNISDGILEFKNKKKQIERQLDLTKKAQKKLADRIAKIDKKTAKWQSMKDKLGLNSRGGETVDAYATNDNEVGDVVISEEQNVASSEVAPLADADTGADAQSDEQNQEDTDDTRWDTDDVSHESESSLENDSEDNGKKMEAQLEQMKQLANQFGELYKMTGNEKTKAVDIIKKVSESRKMIEEYKEVFTEDEFEFLEAGFKKVLKDYDKSGIDSAPEVVSEQIKKDVFNKILRRIPAWLDI